MNRITQPATMTDLRRNPKEALKRMQKEKIVPILVHSKFVGALISMDELNALQEAVKDLRHEEFVKETLQASRAVDRGEYSGPFDTVDAAMRHLDSLSKKK